jgi:Sulfotransferase family
MPGDSADRKRWPNLFVVGAGRAGTSSLWHYLGQHPDIFMSPVKEPYFFTTYQPTFQPLITTEAEYLRLFEQAGDSRWAGEATPSYLRDPETPQRIHDVSPDARILAVLRHPVDRTWSSYWHARRYGVEKRDFDEVLADCERSPRSPSWWYIRGGLYAEPVRRYQSFFGDRLLVLVFEELFADARAGMRRVFEWLEVDPRPAETLRADVLNPYSRPRNRLATRFYSGRAVRFLAKRAVPVALHHRLERVALVREAKPELEPGHRRRLAERFADDVRELERVLGRRLPWDLNA